MALPADTAAYLRALVGDEGGEPPLVAAVEGLLELVLEAVPACVGIRVTVHRHGIALGVSARAGSGPVRGSLALHLPGRGGPGAEPGPVLVLWSGRAGALTAARRDWLALLELDPARAVLDADLDPPREDADLLGAALADVATIDRALGALLEHRGLLPAEGRARLDADAAAAGTSLLVAAAAQLHAPGPPS